MTLPNTVLPSPIYQGAGDSLNAVYVLDFTTYGSITVPFDGMYQGDGVAAVSMFIDNSGDNAAIGYTLDGVPGVVPPYVVGWVDIRGVNSAVFVCSGLVKINLVINNKKQPIGFQSSGLSPLGASGGGSQVGASLFPVSAAIGGSNLTCGLNACTVAYRSPTANDGSVSSLTHVDVKSVVVPNGATLGMVNGVTATLALIAVNNGGVTELGIMNLSGVTSLTENGAINTTAVSAASNSAGIVYSTHALTGVSYRVVGFFTIQEAVVGVWSSNSIVVQGCGGRADYNLIQQAFVLGNLAGIISSTTTYFLTANDAGKANYFVGSNAGQVITLPAVGGTVAGVCFWFVNVATVPVTIKGAGSELIYYLLHGGSLQSSNTLVLNPGDFCMIMNDASASWMEGINGRSGSFCTINKQIITSSGTFTFPVGTLPTTVFKVRGQGAGGGGAGCNGSFVGPGPGAVGGYFERYLSGGTPGLTITTTIGAAGTGGDNSGGTGSDGGTGGATSISSGTATITTVTANGGQGGFRGNATYNGAGGIGGTCTNGDLNTKGKDGVMSSTGVNGVNGPFGFTGAASIFGGEGIPTVGAGGAAVANSGSGGASAAGLSNTSGGNGGSGLIIIEWVL